MADIDVKFGAQTSELNAGVDGAKSKIGEIADSAEGLKSSLEGIAAVVTEVFAIEKLADFASEMANIGLEIENMTHLTGQTVDQVQNFQDSIKLLGGSADGAATTLVRLERNMSDAASGSGEAGQAFQRLGVSMSAIKSGNVTEVLGQMADKMHATADGANKTGAAMEAGGRGAYTLIPILDQGREGIDQLVESIDAVKVKLSPEMAEAFAESAVGMNLLQLATEGAHEAFYSKLEPGLDAAVAGLTQFSAAAANSTQAGQGFTLTAEVIGAVCAGVTAAVLGVATAFEGFLHAVKAAADAIVDSWAGAFKAIKDIVHGDFAQAIKDYDAGLKKAADDTKAELDKSADLWANYYAHLKTMMDVYNGEQSVSPVKLGDTQGKGQIAPHAKNDKNKDDSSTQRGLYAEQYDVKKEYDAMMVQSGQMSHQQELADLSTALNEEQAKIDDSFNKEMALYEAGTVEYQKLQDQKAIADEKFQLEHMKLTQQATEYDSKQWTAAIGVITKTFDQMTTGILQGTQTIGQAFQKMASNLILSFTQAVGKIIIENGLLVIANEFGFTQMAASLTKSLGQWQLVETQKTAAAQAGIRAREVAQDVADEDSATSGASAASKSILQDASEAAAAVYANVAQIPYVGWILAPPAAAAAFGAVMAFDSFASGTDYVPNDMLANIHQGEMIIPRRQADAIRSGGGTGGDGGGSSVSLHVHAMDAASVQSFFKNNSRAVSNALISASRGGHNALHAAFSRM